MAIKDLCTRLKDASMFIAHCLLLILFAGLALHELFGTAWLYSAMFGIITLLIVGLTAFLFS